MLAYKQQQRRSTQICSKPLQRLDPGDQEEEKKQCAIARTQNVQPQHNRRFSTQLRPQCSFQQYPLKSFTKVKEGGSIVLYTSRYTPIEDWIYLAKNKKEIFNKQNVKIRAHASQILGILAYIFHSDNELRHQYKSIEQVASVQLEVIFSHFYRRTELPYPLQSFNIDLQKGLMNFTLDGNFDQFTQNKENQEIVLTAVWDMLTLLMDNYKESINTHDIPKNYQLINKRKLRIVPEIASMKQGSIIFGISFATLFWGVSTAVAIAPAVAAIGAVTYLGIKFCKRQCEVPTANILIQLRDLKNEKSQKISELTDLLDAKQSEPSTRTQTAMMNTQMSQLQRDIVELEKRVEEKRNVLKQRNIQFSRTNATLREYFTTEDSIYLEDGLGQ